MNKQLLALLVFVGSTSQLFAPVESGSGEMYGDGGDEPEPVTSNEDQESDERIAQQQIADGLHTVFAPEATSKTPNSPVFDPQTNPVTFSSVVGDVNATVVMSTGGRQIPAQVTSTIAQVRANIATNMETFNTLQTSNLVENVTEVKALLVDTARNLKKLQQLDTTYSVGNENITNFITTKLQAISTSYQEIVSLCLTPDDFSTYIISSAGKDALQNNLDTVITKMNALIEGQPFGTDLVADLQNALRLKNLSKNNMVDVTSALDTTVELLTQRVAQNDAFNVDHTFNSFLLLKQTIDPNSNVNQDPGVILFRIKRLFVDLDQSSYTAQDLVDKQNLIQQFVDSTSNAFTPEQKEAITELCITHLLKLESMSQISDQATVAAMASAGVTPKQAQALMQDINKNNSNLFVGFWKWLMSLFRSFKVSNQPAQPEDEAAMGLLEGVSPVVTSAASRKTLTTIQNTVGSAY